MLITQFYDLHSGGGQKAEFAQYYFEAPEAEARKLFQEMTGRDPNNITCPCCGEDFSVWDDDQYFDKLVAPLQERMFRGVRYWCE
jgi:hypothetical protein